MTFFFVGAVSLQLVIVKMRIGSSTESQQIIFGCRTLRAQPFSEGMEHSWGDRQKVDLRTHQFYL